MEALNNAWYGSWWPLTNPTQTFRACHLCTFNVATIFFGVIPTYGVLPYAMIRTLPDRLSGLIFAKTSPFCLAKCFVVSTATGSFAKLDSLENSGANWINKNSKNWISSTRLDLQLYSNNDGTIQGDLDRGVHSDYLPGDTIRTHPDARWKLSRRRQTASSGCSSQ